MLIFVIMSEEASDAAPPSLTSGVRVLSNGDVYEGEFQGNIPHGHGLLCLADGSFFFGSFVHGHRQELARRSVSDCENM